MGVSDAYSQLLEAAIQHLQTLKASGVRFVPASPEALALLQSRPGPPAAAVAQTRPAPARAASRPFTSLSIPPQPQAPPSSAQRSAPPVGQTLAAPRSEAKAAAFADLRARALACKKCAPLAAARKNVVFGVGSIDAQLMFVGEAPGADEDAQGEPFVGKAGQLLTKIIQTMGLSRESVFIANILKCRPDTPGQSAGNRKPTPEEMQTCIPYLHEQIDLIQPRVIVALGATAVEGLLGKTIGITRLRGHWQTFRGTPLMPTYHPAYLLRNQALSEKRRVWEDMLQVMEKVGLAITEKQRNYFLSDR
jgi:uracil-DNA glycosylase family 4